MKIYIVRDLIERERPIAFTTRTDAEEHILATVEYSLYKNFNQYLQYPTSTVDYYVALWKKDFQNSLYSYGRDNTLEGYLLWRESGTYIIEEMDVIE